MTRLPLTERGVRLLNRRSKLRTRWVVITGAPCSGKTTTINALKRRGFAIEPDTSRTVIEGWLAESPTQVLNSVDLQWRIFVEMLEIAATLPPGRVIVHEYALPDNIPFWEVEGWPAPPEVVASAATVQYAAVFHLDPLEWEADAVRTHGPEYQADLDRLIWDTYVNLGYRPVRVPRMPALERVDVIAQIMGDMLTTPGVFDGGA
jgi:predicted ATPase